MEPKEFTDLIQRNAGLIHRIACAYSRNGMDQEDIFQEVVLQLWHCRHKYDDRYRETTWIYRIALNVAISFYRRERRHRKGRMPLESRAAPTAVKHAEPSEDVQILLRCIGKLRPLDRALVLLYLDGSDHASIADVLGISVSNVGTKLLRIKNRLRDAFGRRVNDAGGSYEVR